MNALPTSCGKLAGRAGAGRRRASEMLRERDGEAGDEEAVAVGVGVMAADGVQPFARGIFCLMARRNLAPASGCAELQRYSSRQLLEYLDHDRLRCGDAPVQSLAAGGGVEPDRIGKPSADALQNVLRIERPGDIIGGTQRRPASIRGEARPPERTTAAPSGKPLPAAVADLLHALRRAQIDVDHDPRDLIGGSVGNIRRRDGINFAHGLQNAGQFAASIAAVRGKQQTAFG